MGCTHGGQKLLPETLFSFLNILFTSMKIKFLISNKNVDVTHIIIPSIYLPDNEHWISQKSKWAWMCNW